MKTKNASEEGKGKTIKAQQLADRIAELQFQIDQINFHLDEDAALSDCEESYYANQGRILGAG